MKNIWKILEWLLKTFVCSIGFLFVIVIVGYVCETLVGFYYKSGWEIRIPFLLIAGGGNQLLLGTTL
jgi:hypothetical protein